MIDGGLVTRCVSSITILVFSSKHSKVELFIRIQHSPYVFGQDVPSDVKKNKISRQRPRPHHSNKDQDHTTQDKEQDHTTQDKEQDHTTQDKDQDHTTQDKDQDQTTQDKEQDHTTQDKDQD